MAKRLRVVVLGKSPLAYFLAFQLDRVLGPLVQYELVWVLDSSRFVLNPLDYSPTYQHGVIDLKSHFDHVTVKTARVTSVNLRTEQITTTRGTVEYDFLLIDQLPYYSADELKAVYGEFLRVLSVLSASTKMRGSIDAAVGFKDRSAASWQLSLALRGYQMRHFPSVARRLRIAIDSDHKAVQEFLREHSIAEPATQARLKNLLTIHPPASIISNRQIKGATVDRSGRIKVDAVYRVRGYDNVLCFDTPELVSSNISRVLHTFARSISDVIERFFAGEHQESLEPLKTSLLLQGSSGRLLLFGRVTSRTIRSAVVANLERSFRRRISRRRAQR